MVSHDIPEREIDVEARQDLSALGMVGQPITCLNTLHMLWTRGITKALSSTQCYSWVLRSARVLANDIW
jgi:hypothetical protein